MRKGQRKGGEKKVKVKGKKPISLSYLHRTLFRDHSRTRHQVSSARGERWTRQ